MQVKTNVA